jgi:8-hydroxy-5-deazaflavin:NADPH oxidoreductase
MTTIGLIGSGRIGGTVARLSVVAGHAVVLSNSRGPETLKDLVAELGQRARAATAGEAAEAGEIAVVSVPFQAYRSVPAGPLAGKTVIDSCNYRPQRGGHVAELDNGSLTSSELLQRHLAQSSVVKAFNNIFYRHLLALSRAADADDDRSSLPIAGDDPDAKAAVTAFLGSIGYGAVDAGPLSESWRQEPGTPVSLTPYGSTSDEAGTPAGADTIQAALAAARR